MRPALIAALLAVCLATSGCWDRIEIQDRGMVKALGIDLAPPQVPSGETFTSAHGGAKYLVSFQLIRLAPAGGGKSKSPRQTYVVAGAGQSIFEILRDTLGQTSKTLNFEHLDSIVISEAVVKETGLRPLIDLFIREPEFRWRTRLYITTGKARAILEHEPVTGEPGGQFINGIANNQFRNAHLAVSRTDIGYTTATLDNDGDAFLPRLELDNGVLKMGGAALFRHDKFIGYMDDYALQGARLMRGLQKSAAISAECPDHPGKLLVLKMIKSQSTVKPYIDGEGLYCSVYLEVDGNLEEFQCLEDHNIDPEIIPVAEKLFAREIENNIMYSVRAAQTMRVDPTGFFSREIKAHQPAFWRRMQPNWRETIAAVRFLVHAKVTIKNLGAHK